MLVQSAFELQECVPKEHSSMSIKTKKIAVVITINMELIVLPAKNFQSAVHSAIVEVLKIVSARCRAQILFCAMSNFAEVKGCMYISI